jgi:hypothetical protein
VQAADGSWRITGQKIYITFGDHDLADNIVHLVLARIDGAPPGTKGISCFIVPKFLVGDDGVIGSHNDVRCVSIEHKMGIHASPTCVLSFGDAGQGAVGELIGEPNTGMRTMFVMMNNARLSVGLQGLSVSERAYQMAVAHALSRVQGKPIGAPDATIVEHPDVRRMLLTVKATNEAMRLLLYSNAAALDLARHSDSADVRRGWQERADLLTPLSKGWCTDAGNDMVSLSLQVHGGMGFVEDTGVAQMARDLRIAPIYEGTNGIQALDLIGRKLPMHDGAVIASLLAELRGELPGLVGELADLVEPLVAGFDLVEELAAWVSATNATAPADVMAGATPLLRLVATTVAAGLMARQARLAVASGEAGRVVTARFFITQVLPQVHGLRASVVAGASSLFALDAAALASS